MTEIPVLINNKKNVHFEGILHDSCLYIRHICAAKMNTYEHNGTDLIIEILKTYPSIAEIAGVLASNDIPDTVEKNVNSHIIYGWRHSISFYIGLPRYINQLGRSFTFHIYDDENYKNEVTSQIVALGKEAFIEQYIKSHSSPERNGSFKYTSN